MKHTYWQKVVYVLIVLFILIQGISTDAEETPTTIPLIKNGDFSLTDTTGQHIAGIDGTAYWFFSSNMGGTGKASLDEGVLKVTITIPGSAVYAIQVIQAPIEIVSGTTYRVSFKAKASTERTIDVKVGGLAKRQWKDYTKGEGTGRIISITPEMQTYSFGFVMTDPTDSQARLEFQLGEYTPSTVWLDDVRIDVIATADALKTQKEPIWTPNPYNIAIPLITNRGASVPFIQYEAEDAKTNGGVIGPERAVYQIATEASGRKAVQLRSAGEYVEFTLQHPANALVVRYCIPDAPDGKGLQAPLSLYVNDAYRQDLVLSSEFTWIYGSYPGTNNPDDGTPKHFFDEVRVLIGDVAAGATIRLQRESQNTLDYVVIDLLDAEQVPVPLVKPENFLAITEYGAIPDDNGDDTRPMFDCIEAAKHQGKGVWVPSGVFQFNTFLPRRTLGGVVMRGAGMWYSVLQVRRNAFFGTGGRFEIHDLAIFGNSTVRNDEVAESGFHGDLGQGSLIENVWFHHLKVGVWSEKHTDGLIIRGCRFRNLLADGINFCLGTQNSIVEQSHFRGTGDDAIATWSAKYLANAQPSAYNIIRWNTIQSPWLANGIAIYGGHDHVVEDNVIYDTIDKGAGINISSMFDPIPFSGAITIQRNTLIRCGSPNPQNELNARGAIWIWAANQDIDTNLVIRDIDIYDATYAGILIEGRKMLRQATFENIAINGAGTWGIHTMTTAKGAASFANVTMKYAVLGGLHQQGEFIIEKQPGNVGW
jgi:hypothetical protein